MKRNAGSHARRFLIPILALAALFALYRHSTRPVAEPKGTEGNNPQKFHLQATGTSFSYSFTYDPHAADVWRFKSSAGNLLPVQTNSPRAPPVTNRWTGP